MAPVNSLFNSLRVMIPSPLVRIAAETLHVGGLIGPHSILCVSAAFVLAVDNQAATGQPSPFKTAFNSAISSSVQGRVGGRGAPAGMPRAIIIALPWR